MGEIFKTYLSVGLGSALGGMGRLWLSDFVAERIGETFPWGTLAVNVSGSLVIGFFAGLTDVDGKFLVPQLFRQFFMMGICGGYTTFSSFSWQTLNLVREGEWLYAGANALFSFALCMIAVWLGYLAGEMLNH
ncbi:MAG: fluoride efflux transporter CrcB [Limisphaerales bacterium]